MNQRRRVFAPSKSNGAQRNVDPGAAPGEPDPKEASSADPTYGLPPVLTAKETARFLNLDPKTVYASINEGELPARKVRHRTVIFRDALLDWLRSDKRGLSRRRRKR